MIGRTVAHYEIQAKLGSGAMGEVYLAYDTKLGRKVALKFLPESLSSDLEARTRLLLEAQNASILNHPNVVTIHAIENVDGRDFIVMEFIEGQTLKSLLESGPLSMERVVEIGGAICDGLAAAHEKGIIHRDIKPDNIFLTARGHVKIADFGIARSEQGAGLTRTGMPVGTVAYMSPEQARGEKDLDSRSDLFSLGCLLYEMAAGERPFKGEHLTAVLYELLSEDPAPPSTAVPELPREFDRIIFRALAKAKDARYKSAAEIGAALRALQSVPSSAVPVAFHRPDVHYAHSGDVSVAYSILGDGPIDVVFVGGWVSNIELYWTHPYSADFLRRLMSFCRLIIFDKRGTGLSDNVKDMPTLEQRMDDVRAVMDSAGSERAVIFGVSEGGSMSALFAATYPERTHALVLFGAFAKRIWDPDYPWAPTPDQRQKWFELIEHGWGGTVDLDTLAPTLHHDEEFREWWSDFLRQSARPRAALDLAHMNTQIDIRHLLPSIRVPTLILHRTGDRDVKIDEARYMSAHIPGAVLRELPGEDHLIFAGDREALLHEVESFVNRIASSPPPEETLATVAAVRLLGKGGNAKLAEFRTLVEDIASRFKPGLISAEVGHMLVAFDGPARAVRCAQAVMEEGARRHLRLAIGVHIGTCTLTDDKLDGPGARVAVELSDIAEADQVLLSGPVRDLTAGSGLQFQERDTVTVHSWSEPLRLHEVPRLKLETENWFVKNMKVGILLLVLAIVAISAVGYLTFSKYFGFVARSQSDSRKMLAVLPFKNFGSLDQEYFADGLTEEVISKLTGVTGLGVISRTSVMTYKGTKKTTRQIADDLGVDYLMEGSVQWTRAEGRDRFRIKARLVAASDETSLWDATYDSLLTDAFAVQTEIAQRVTGAMHITLVESERQNLVRGGTKNLYALLAFYRGNSYLHSSGAEEGAQLAIAAYEEAVKNDSTYVQAWARLARAHAKMVWWGFDRHQTHRAQSKLAMERAAFLDSDAPETQLARGYYFYWVERDNRRALEQFTAIEQNAIKSGEIFDVYTVMAYVERRLGEFDRAIAHLQISLTQDPDLRVKDAAPRFAERAWELGNTLLRLRRWPEAERSLEQAMAFDPNQFLAYRYLSHVQVYGYANPDSAARILAKFPAAIKSNDAAEDRVQVQIVRRDPVAARSYLKASLQKDADTAYYNLQRAWIAALEGDEQDERTAYDSARADLERQVRVEPKVSSLRRYLGICYAGLGRREDALREGRKALELDPPERDAFFRGPSNIEGLARIHAMLGDLDAAVDLLDSLLSLPAGLITPEYLKIAPEYDALRGYPAFEMLISRGQPTAAKFNPATMPTALLSTSPARSIPSAR